MILKIYHEKALDYEFIDRIDKVRCEHNKYCACIEKADNDALYVNYKGMRWDEENNKWESTEERLYAPFQSYFNESEFRSNGKLGDFKKVKVIVYEKDGKDPEHVIVDPLALIWILNDSGKTIDKY